MSPSSSVPTSSGSGADELPPSQSLSHAMKRIFDLVVSLVGLIVLSPLMLVVAVLVGLTSTGPILFRQQRVGRNFRPFRICKFRTMVADAPRRGKALTAGADPRITKVGRVLRATKIDEMPQLWNVLVGEMSLVGPRPEVPVYVKMFHAEFAEILSVRPGITDPASLKFSRESELLAEASDPEKEYIERILPEKIAISRDYIRRRGMVYDLGILLQTLLRVFS